MPFAIVLDAGLLEELHRAYEDKAFLRHWWSMWAPRDPRSRPGAIVQPACGLHDRAPFPGLGPLGYAPWRRLAATVRQRRRLNGRGVNQRKRTSTVSLAQTHQGDGHPRSAVAARPEGVAQASDDGSGGMAWQLCSRPVRQRRRGRRPRPELVALRLMTARQIRSLHVTTSHTALRTRALAMRRCRNSFGCLVRGKCRNPTLVASPPSRTSSGGKYCTT